MSWWVLFDKLLPITAVGAAGAVGICLGRAYERIDWLTGDKQTPTAPTAARSNSAEAARHG